MTKHQYTFPHGRKLCQSCKGNGYLPHKVGTQYPPQCQKCEGYGDVPDKRFAVGACRTPKQRRAARNKGTSK